MVQVALYPASSTSYRDTGKRASSQNASALGPTVQLPRKLARPEYEEISWRAIVSASPEMASARGITPEYIQETMVRQSAQLYGGLNSLAPSHLPTSLPKSHLPKHLSIPVRDSSKSVEYPSHALAIFSSKSPDAQALIIPIHALVIASHCARFPEIRVPASSLHATGRTLHLPVIPVSLPSPGAFPVLSTFMYDHRLDKVLESLFPTRSGLLNKLSHKDVMDILDSQSTIYDLASYVCDHDHYNLQTLTSHTMRIRDVWQDMVSLGVHDSGLWSTIDLAWEVVLTALNIAASGRG